MQRANGKIGSEAGARKENRSDRNRLLETDLKGVPKSLFNKIKRHLLGDCHRTEKPSNIVDLGAERSSDSRDCTKEKRE